MAKVVITLELLFRLLTQDNIMTAARTTRGIPQDAVFLYSYTDDRRAETYLVFEHPSFAVIPPGSEIPTIRIEIMNYYGLEAIRLILEMAANAP